MDAALQRCLAFVQCQLKPGSSAGPASDRRRWRAVTISRQSGAGGHAVAEKLAALLQSEIPGSCPWTIFDRNIVEKVLADHQLPARLAQFMPEDRVSEMQDTIEDLLGVHPSRETLIHKTTETILQLAELGNVILLGRGANVVARKLHHVFHVRLVGSLEQRARCVKQQQGLAPAAALKLVCEEDRGRKRYLKKYYNEDIDNPLLYHLVINTDLVAPGAAAATIAAAMTLR